MVFAAIQTNGQISSVKDELMLNTYECCIIQRIHYFSSHQSEDTPVIISYPSKYTDERLLTLNPMRKLSLKNSCFQQLVMNPVP